MIRGRSLGTRAAAALSSLALPLLLTALPAASAPPPPSSSSPAAASPVQLELASQPAWVVTGGLLPIQLRVSGALTPDLMVTAVPHEAVTSRIGYENALRGTRLGGVLGGQVPEVPVAALPVAADGTRTLTLGLDNPATPLNLAMRRTGVYPLEITVRNGDGDDLAGFVTPVVAVAPGPNNTAPVGQRLAVAWVWPLVAQPAYGPDNNPDPKVVSQLHSQGRLGSQSLVLARHAVPLTLAPGPETLESWRQLARGDPDLQTTFTSMRAALAQGQVLSSPYVPIDVPSLLNNGFSSQISDELIRGTETLGQVLGARVDPRTAVERPLNDATVVRMSDANTDRMVVESAALTPRDQQFTQAQPFLLRSQARNVTAVAADDGLQRLLEGNDPPALRAQRFLAGLSVVALEQPNVTRGVVVLNPEDWSPSPELLDAVLTGLRADHPLVQAMSVDDLFNNVPVAQDGRDSLVRQVAPTQPAPAPVSERDYRSTQADLASFNSILTQPSVMSTQADRSLLVSISSVWSGPEGRSRAQTELGAVRLQIAQFTDRIRVPADSTITLTARKARVPLTFLNQTGQTIRVHVQLQSDKLLFPDGDQHDLELAPNNTTVNFTVETRSSGTFPLSVKVTSPAGLAIQDSKVQIRSTFVSHVGVYVTIGAAVFLALWWANDFRRRRKRRIVTAEVEPARPAKAAPDLDR